MQDAVSFGDSILVAFGCWLPCSLDLKSPLQVHEAHSPSARFPGRHETALSFYVAYVKWPNLAFTSGRTSRVLLSSFSPSRPQHLLSRLPSSARPSSATQRSASGGTSQPVPGIPCTLGTFLY
jgi:hypothetical protein